MLEQILNDWREANAAATNAEQEAGRKRAVRELVLGLMRGNAAEHKLGYTAENAMLAAVSLMDREEHLLSEEQAKRYCTPVLGQDDLAAFLRYLADEQLAGPQTLIEAVEKPHKWWREFMDSLVAAERGNMPAPTPVGQPA